MDDSRTEESRGATLGIPHDADEKDIIKILISTDNHIGYAEKDEVRANDSLIAFEEVLQLAQKNDVDMILLGKRCYNAIAPCEAHHMHVLV